MQISSLYTRYLGRVVQESAAKSIANESILSRQGFTGLLCEIPAYRFQVDKCRRLRSSFFKFRTLAHRPEAP